MSPRYSLALLAASFLSISNVFAHEFWIEPEQYQVESGAPLIASLRNGENFKGSSLAFFDRHIERLEFLQNSIATPYVGRMGDIPAIETTAPSEGLLTIVHQTSPSTLKYKTWEKFQAFADHKDFPDIRTRHKARGLPETGFTERYTRYVKTLIAIGSGLGTDAISGMETEFVALKNPYVDDLREGLPVLLVYQGKPRANAQIEIFQKTADNSVEHMTLRTDAEGKANITVKSGHQYLLDAVVLRPLPDGSSEVWETLWAGLSFEVP